MEFAESRKIQQPGHGCFDHIASQSSTLKTYGRVWRNQHLLYEDVVILPMYERGFSFVIDPRLKISGGVRWVRKLIITMRISNRVLSRSFNPDSRSR